MTINLPGGEKVGRASYSMSAGFSASKKLLPSQRCPALHSHTSTPRRAERFSASDVSFEIDDQVHTQCQPPAAVSTATQRWPHSPCRPATMPPNEAITYWSCGQSVFNMCYPFDCRCKSAFQCQVANLRLPGQTAKPQEQHKSIVKVGQSHGEGGSGEDKFHFSEPCATRCIFHDSLKLNI